VSTAYPSRERVHPCHEADGSGIISDPHQKCYGSEGFLGHHLHSMIHVHQNLRGKIGLGVLTFGKPCRVN